MSLGAKGLLLDVRDRLRNQVSAFSEDVYCGADEDEEEQLRMIRPPYSVCWVASMRRQPDAAGLYLHRIVVGVSVVVQIRGREKAVAGGHGKSGMLDLVDDVIAALEGHYFSPSGGDRSGPWEFAADHHEGIEVTAVPIADVPDREAMVADFIYERESAT